jgi:hypothetical protein
MSKSIERTGNKKKNRINTFRPKKGNKNKMNWKND